MKVITPEQWNDNIFHRIEKDWMLITTETVKSYNTMTASFGGFGNLFFKNVASVYIRPQRFTYTLMEKSDYFSLSFFNGEQYRKQLQYCGKVSGREENKLEACGFTIDRLDNVPYIKQADITVLCRKIYACDINKGIFYDMQIKQNCYPDGDTHRMYVGEILKVLEAE